MSVRTPIQVPMELKSKMDDMKGSLRASSQYEVIEKLIAYYENGEKQKITDHENRLAEKKRQEETMILVGEDLKTRYNEFQHQFGYRNESAGLKLLLEHFNSSDKFGRGVLELLQLLK